MTGLPAVNTLILVVVNESADFRSRIEDVDGSKLTIAGPLGLNDLELPENGFEMELFWTFANARYRLPVKLTGRTRGRLGKWNLVAVGPPVRCNRRRFVRGGGGGSVRIIAAENRTRVETFEGHTIDICEGGVRCHLRWTDLKVGDEVIACFSLGNRPLQLTGNVHSVRAEDNGRGVDIVVAYELPEREAQEIRRYVLQCQITERRRALEEDDRRMAS
jgi:c-di-GMP-binding flagellar brake protein YcgR